VPYLLATVSCRIDVTPYSLHLPFAYAQAAYWYSREGINRPTRPQLFCERKLLHDGIRLFI